MSEKKEKAAPEMTVPPMADEPGGEGVKPADTAKQVVITDADISGQGGEITGAVITGSAKVE